MDKKRYDVLLFNAIDWLLGLGFNRYRIMEEIGITEEEFESVGAISDNQKTGKAAQSCS